MRSAQRCRATRNISNKTQCGLLCICALAPLAKLPAARVARACFVLALRTLVRTPLLAPRAVQYDIFYEFVFTRQKRRETTWSVLGVFPTEVRVMVPLSLGHLRDRCFGISGILWEMQLAIAASNHRAPFVSFRAVGGNGAHHRSTSDRPAQKNLTASIGVV